jgi:hypothetical protein
MINNYNLINNYLLDFPNEESFYHIQLIKRKKDNKNTPSYRILKTYYIKSKEHLASKMEEIINLCNHNQARAYINVNRKNIYKASKSMLIDVATAFVNKQYWVFKTIFDSAVGNKYSNEGNKLWILDIDNKNHILLTLNKEKLGKITELVLILETPNGFHIIFKACNLTGTELDGEVHKNNPTILYSP